MAKHKAAPKKTNNDNLMLFDLGPPTKTEPEVRRLPNPVWTEHKAQLIERYLYFFVMITKHGAYIDGFAGPQEEEDNTDRWSAKLVIESEPRWLQKFFLFDKNPKQVKRLNDLVNLQPPNQPKRPKRKYEVGEGDFNDLLPEFLAKRPIKDKEASFALLDQRTFECEWSSVEALAKYKPENQHKIELFYFLPNHWLDRALAATKDKARLKAWWGRDDWAILRGQKAQERAQLVADRIKALGYASVKPWPIMQRDEGAVQRCTS